MAERTFEYLQQQVLWHVHGETTTTNVSTVVLDRVKFAINRALTAVTNRIKMMQMKKVGTFGLVNGEGEYTLPTDFAGFVNGTVYYDDGSNSYPVVDITEQEWTRQAGQSVTEQSEPVYFTMSRYDADLKKWVCKIRPEPSGSQGGKFIKFEYYGFPSEMTANADVPPIPGNLHEGLVNGAVVLGFPEFIQDQQTASFLMGEWQEFLRECRKHADPLVGRSMRFKDTRDRPYAGRPLTNFTIP